MLESTKGYGFQAGYSLLEVMLAISLGLVIFGGVLKSYLVFKRTCATRTSLVKVAENIRFVDWVLWKNITRAGFTGDYDISKLDFYNPYHKRFGVRGYAKDEGDVLVVGYVSDAFWKLSDYLIDRGRLSLIRGANFKKGDILFVIDNKNAELVQIADVSGKEIILSRALKHSYNKAHARLRKFIENSFLIVDTKRVDRFGQIVRSLYLIDGGGKSELIAGVEEMKVLYGIKDITDMGVKYLSAEEIDNQYLWPHVLLVMIKLRIKDHKVSQWKTLYVKIRRQN